MELLDRLVHEYCIPSEQAKGYLASGTRFSVGHNCHDSLSLENTIHYMEMHHHYVDAVVEGTVQRGFKERTGHYSAGSLVDVTTKPQPPLLPDDEGVVLSYDLGAFIESLDRQQAVVDRICDDENEAVESELRGTWFDAEIHDSSRLVGVPLRFHDLAGAGEASSALYEALEESYTSRDIAFSLEESGFGDKRDQFFMKRKQGVSTLFLNTVLDSETVYEEWADPWRPRVMERAAKNEVVRFGSANRAKKMHSFAKEVALEQKDSDTPSGVKTYGFHNYICKSLDVSDTDSDLVPYRP